MTQSELNITANYIQTLASQPDSHARISLFLDSLFASFPQKENPSAQKKRKSVSSNIYFSRKEASQMSKTFKKEFIANGLVAHVVKRQRCKNCTIYMIRYRRNGYNICISANSLEEAKKRFLIATKSEQIENYQTRKKGRDLNTFLFVTKEWLEFRKSNLNERTHKNYESYCNRFLFPVLGESPIADIKTIDVSNIMSAVQGRIYEDLRIVLNSIFKYALANGLIINNPMLLIPFKKSERVNRRALTADELRRFVRRLDLPEFKKYKRTFLILLFFGLRPCELEDARFEGDFLIARNAKRKGGKIEYKKIPLCNQARELLDTSAPVEYLHKTNFLNRLFQRIIEDKEITQYSLRHTFATICQQYVRPDVVDIWMGDSSERLVGRVYTHFPDDFMVAQMRSVVFEF